MLLNLHKKSWMDGLQLTDYKEHSANNEKTIKVSTSTSHTCESVCTHMHVLSHQHVSGSMSF